VSQGRDIYGNVMNTDTSHSFVVDTTKPSSPTIATMPHSVLSNAFIITLSAPSADDNFSRYQLQGGLYNDWTDTTQTDDFFFGLRLGSNILQVRAVDGAGNISDADNVEIIRLPLLDKGDINGDDKVDLIDAIIVLKVLNQIECPEVASDYANSGADVNGDGKVGIEELVFILETCSRLRSP